MFIVVALATLAQAASVNVSPGDDLTAVTSSLQPGDVVLFNAGTYVLDGSVYWTGVGTEQAPIEFRAAEGAQVILQNAGGGYVANLENSSWVRLSNLIFEGADPEYTQPSGLRIYESSYITVEDCVVRNVWGTALRIEGNAQGMQIRHNELSFTGDGSGLYVGCWDGACWMQDSLIEFNLIHDVQGTGIYLNPGSQSLTVENNVIFRTRDSGMWIGNTNFGPQNTIKANAIWQTEGDGMYVRGSALIQNNLVFETGGDGLYTNNDGEELVDLQISHNTFARNDGYAAYLGDWYDKPDMVFSNNALANTTGYGFRWDDDFDPYYNAVETSNYITNNVVTGLVEGFDLLARPGFVIPGGGVGDFVDADNFDFYPTPTSELRDAADAAGNAYLPVDDFNGTQRDGASPDVGAYEYDGEGNPGWVVQEGYKELTEGGGRGGSTVATGCCGSGKSEGTEAVVLLPLLALGVGVRRRRS